ncbi:hypothetical protein BKA93DRAFT_364114 [Sparassis latifolia]
MPPSRSWFSPPTRRELTLLLFSLSIFVLAYNLESSLHFVGVHPEKSAYLSTIGLSAKDPGFDPDGRRPKEWRDDLEALIFGNWQWEEGKVSGVEHGAVGLGLGDAAIYGGASGRKASRSAGKEDWGVGVNKGVSVHEQFVRWGPDVPVTKALAHVPGYTILDNVLIANGTFFLVTDDPSSLPPPAAIAFSTLDHTQPPDQHWQVLTKDEARTQLGTYGGRIYGTSWVATDPPALQDPYTFLSLFHAHSTLSSPDSKAGVPAPLRLMLPHVPTFSSPQLPSPGGDNKIHPPPRERSYNGFHPLLPKAVIPTLGLWYQEDWEDLAEMNLPWLLERVVIADRGAAERGRENWGRRWRPADRMAEISDHDFKRAEDDDGKPAWAAPFVGLKAPEGWWGPVRTALARYLRLPEQSQSSAGSGWRKKKAVVKPVVTYVSMQDEPFTAGPRLRDDHHEALVAGLADLQGEGLASEVFVVRGNGSVDVHGWEWEERMNAVARSSVVLGPYGFHLADSIFMSPSPSSSLASPSAPSSQEQAESGPILMEFFPPGTFVRDQEFAARSLGLRYMAWWNDRKFTGDSLPPVMLPDESSLNQRIPIEPNAVVQAVREELSRR